MKLKIPQYQLSEVLNMMAFKGISEADIKTMMDLGILREHYYRYNSTIFKAGEITEELRIVIKGRVIVENVDYWGSKSTWRRYKCIQFRGRRCSIQVYTEDRGGYG